MIDLRPPERLILSKMPQRKWLTTAEIYERCGLTEAVARRALERLYDNHLVQMKYSRHPISGKSLLYALPPSGKRVIPPLYPSLGMDARPLARAFGNYTYART